MTLGSLFAILSNRGEDPTKVLYQNKEILGPGVQFKVRDYDQTKANGTIVGGVRDGLQVNFFVFADAHYEAEWETGVVALRKPGEEVRREDVHPQVTYLIENIKSTADQYYRLWWSPNRTGYTRDLDSAGRYTGRELEECCLNVGNYRLFVAKEVETGKCGRVAKVVQL